MNKRVAAYGVIRVALLLAPDAGLARYLDTGTGRFVTMDTFAGNNEDPLSLHKYLYAEDAPVDNDDPSGNEIDLQDHEVRLIGVGTTDYHSLIRITPENQTRWKNDKRFSNHDEKGRVYCTIGAGPDSTAYYLIAGVNRVTDLTGPADSIPLPVPSRYPNEDKLIHSHPIAWNWLRCPLDFQGFHRCRA